MNFAEPGNLGRPFSEEGCLIGSMLRPKRRGLVAVQKKVR